MFVLSIRSNASTQQSLLKISSESVGIPSFIGNELTPDASNCVSIMKEIKLSQGKFALVDDEDFEFLNQWKWYAIKVGNTFYASRITRDRVHIGMHRLILGVDNPKVFIDHKDHDGLNNQKNNIRIATQKQNAANMSAHKNSSSKFLGVSKAVRNKGRNIYWQAQSRIDGKDIHFGYFKTEEAAARAYDSEVSKYRGEFTNLNFK